MQHCYKKKFTFMPTALQNLRRITFEFNTCYIKHFQFLLLFNLGNYLKDISLNQYIKYTFMQ